MAKLVYVTLSSLDGYIGRDKYDWSAPSEDFLGFITDVTRPIGTYLYGRKTYETMAVWETPEKIFESMNPAEREYADVWQRAQKVVYSRTLDRPWTPNTTLKRELDLQEIRKLKSTLPHDFCISGPELSAHALTANLVDEFHLFLVPVMLGEGIAIFPAGCSMTLSLLELRRFENGWLYLRYVKQA